MNKNTIIRETANFALTESPTGRFSLHAKAKKVTPRAVRISTRDAKCYLATLSNDEFDVASVWDFGCGGFQAGS